MGLTNHTPEKKLPLRNLGREQDPHRHAAPGEKNIKIVIFWGVSPCRQVPTMAVRKVLLTFLRWKICNPEDGNYRFIRDIDIYKTTRFHIPEDIRLSICDCENPKSQFTH